MNVDEQDELCDQMRGLESNAGARQATAEGVDGADEPAPADERDRRRHRGLARYRTAVLVGAGGLACAAVGALLGGLDGSFPVSTAGAPAVASTSPDTPLADAVNHPAPLQNVGSLPPGPGGGVPGPPVTGLPVAGPSGTAATSTGALGPVVGGVTGAAGGAPGSSTPRLPSLPLPTPGTIPTLPSLPTTAPTGSLGAPAGVTTRPALPVGGSASGTITVPLAVPTPVPPVHVGPAAAGTGSGDGSTTGGLRLNLGGS